MYNRYYPLSVYFKSRFGQRIQKIPLDGPATCPNRDGTISRRGCSFCNPKGSGTGLGDKGMSLAEQCRHWQTRLGRKYKSARFMLYLQSYTNTHGPIWKLKNMLHELAELPHTAGLCIGTRPDCLDPDKIALISEQPWEEIWLDIGLQSSNDHTLQAINRGHSSKDFALTCEMAASAGLKVCAHVIAGLPGEDCTDFLKTIRFLNRLDIQGIKIHNLYICHETQIAEDYYSGKYTPLSKTEFVNWTIAGLEQLSPHTVVHRLNGDPAPGELIAPSWAADKQGILADIRSGLEKRNTWQGKALYPQNIPAWFENPDPVHKK